MSELLRRILHLLRRSKLESEFVDEIETHRSLRQAALERDGLAPDAAYRESRRQLGQVLLAREDAQDVWAVGLDTFGRDLRYAVAALRRRPAFGVLAGATLSLAIGANLVVFAVVNALWLRPIAVPEPERVAMVTAMSDGSGTGEGHYFGAVGLESYLRGQPGIELVAGQVATSGEMSGSRPLVSLPIVGEVETLAVTSDYFAVMGLSIVGRDFRLDDDTRGAAPVAILSHDLWLRAFEGSSEVIGSLAAATPVPLRIIGVAPPGFTGARHGERTELWIPRLLTQRVAAEGMAPDDPVLLAYVRFRDGVSLSDAQRQLRDVNPQQTYQVIPISQLYGSPVGRTIVLRQDDVLWVAAVVAALVMVAGCATLMSLVLVFYERRRQELAIKMALGCGRKRLVRTLAAELAILALCGSIGALGMSSLVLGGLPALSLPGGVDLGRIDLRPDWRVLAVGLAASGATLGLAALLPIARSTRLQLVADVEAASIASTPSSLGLRRLILAVHVAATLIVLVAAGLFVRTVVHGLSAGAGIQAERLLFVEAQIRSAFRTSSQRQSETSDERYARWTARLEETIAAIERIPGIEAVLVGDAPVGLDAAAAVSRPRNLIVDGEERTVTMAFRNVAPAYSSALGVPLLSGRPLSDSDIPSVLAGQVPVHVTRSAAQALWPGGSALGREFRISSRFSFVVAGVIGDMAFGTQRLGVRSGVFVPLGVAQAARSMSVGVVARTAVAPERLVDPVRSAILGAVPNAPQVEVLTGAEVLRLDLGRERLGAWFFSGFGLVGIVLAVGSVFGLVAHLVETRRREFGVRLALGASPKQLRGLVMRAGMAPVLIGVAFGLAGGATLAQMIEAVVFGISEFDPITFGAAAGVMAVGGAAASRVAGARVSRVSPTDLLRSE